MLAVDANIRAESANLRVSIEGHGAVLTCRLAGDATHMLWTLRRAPDLLRAIRTLVPLLVRAGLRVDVLAGTVRIGRAGSGVRQNALARLLRIPSAHLGI